MSQSHKEKTEKKLEVVLVMNSLTEKQEQKMRKRYEKNFILSKHILPQSVDTVFHCRRHNLQTPPPSTTRRPESSGPSRLIQKVDFSDSASRRPRSHELFSKVFVKFLPFFFNASLSPCQRCS